ncbi:hypothetical protein KGO95_02360 [Patescibacteria group bacterium]|nr:hypothetical protein [Patescibacteria group bacterium]
MDKISFPKIKEVLKMVWDSPHAIFYRKKYEQAGLTPDLLVDPSIFLKLPFLERSELQATDPLQRLYIPREEIYFAAYSSGTTSQMPLITYYAKIPNYQFDPTLGLGVQRLFFLFPPINKHFSHTLAQQCDEAGTGSYPIFGDIYNLPNSAVIAQRCEADALFATPTLAFMLHPYVQKYYDPGKLHLVGLCGETLSAARREQLQKLYPAAKIVNLYASSEIGQYILFPCKELIEKDLELFHPHPALLATELLDTGELVITYAGNAAMPLIRYRTGDMFAYADAQCSCGKPTLQWKGRVNADVVRIAGMEFKLTDLERIMVSFADTIGDRYQVHFYQKLQSGGVETEMIVELAVPSNNELGASVIDTLMHTWHLTSYVTLGDAVMKGMILKPQVKFVDALSTKTEKTRHLINHID